MQMTETKHELSARAERYAELDRLANELGPNMDDKRLFSLKFEEMSYVLSMAHLYMLARMGWVSKDIGAKIKRKYILRTEHIHNDLVHARYMYHRQLINTITYTKDMNDLAELLRSGSPVALPKALEIIDELSGSYILSVLYDHAARNTDIDECINEVVADEDSREKLKVALCRFLGEIDRDYLPSVFAELGSEELKELANRIPTREIYDSNIPKELLLKP